MKLIIQAKSHTPSQLSTERITQATYIAEMVALSCEGRAGLAELVEIRALAGRRILTADIEALVFI